MNYTYILTACQPFPDISFLLTGIKCYCSGGGSAKRFRAQHVTICGEAVNTIKLLFTPHHLSTVPESITLYQNILHLLRASRLLLRMIQVAPRNPVFISGLKGNGTQPVSFYQHLNKLL